MQARRLHHKEDDRVVMRLCARNPAVVATQHVYSTVDTPQSASKAIYHSYLSESRGGPGPT